MAQHTIRIDDIDGSAETVSTITFALDADTYEIDLNEEHTRQLRETLQYWIAHARRVKNPRKTRSISRATTNTAKVRAWANANGYQLPQRGKISRTIFQAYEQAHQGDPSAESHSPFPQ